ncbi:hypothetical protein ACFLY4_02215 [Chloroflexota bacterium]
MVDPTLLMSITAKAEIEEIDRRAAKLGTFNRQPAIDLSELMKKVASGLTLLVAITSLIVLLIAAI